MITNSSVWLDDKGVPHGTVSDEQIIAVLGNAIAICQKRSGLQEPHPTEVGEAVTDEMVTEYIKVQRARIEWADKMMCVPDVRRACREGITAALALYTRPVSVATDVTDELVEMACLAAVEMDDGAKATWYNRTYGSEHSRNAFRKGMRAGLNAVRTSLATANSAEGKVVPDGWLLAVDNALVVLHIGVANSTDSYDEAKAKLDQLIALEIAIATDPEVNGGHVLVPVEPSESMLKAGNRAVLRTPGGQMETLRGVYKAMLNATASTLRGS